MSITNLKNNLLIYCNLKNNIIIKCICLTKIYKLNEYGNTYNENFEYLICDKVKIITIYDINKNIISEPVRTELFKDSIKINNILENLKENHIYFFKTFTGALILYDKLNDITYDIGYTGIIYNILYDNVYINFNNFIKTINIDNKERDLQYMFGLNNSHYRIYCFKNKNYIIYTINNYYIEIHITKQPYFQVISFYKKCLKIFKIQEYYKCMQIYEEKRNNNNEVTNWKKYNNGKIIEEFISNNINPPFSKQLKKYCIELINHYNNIILFTKIVKPIIKKINKAQHNLLLNYNLEMINFK